MTDSLEHYGVLGMKWGVRRTPEQLGHRRPKTSIEKWKSKKINAIDKVYNKTYKKLDKAALESPDDKSISKYRKQLEKQHKKDVGAIADLSYVEVMGERARESDARKQKALKSAAVAGNATLWASRMALTLVRIGGMALAVDILANAGNTIVNALGEEKIQRSLQVGSDLILKIGNTSLNQLNDIQKYASGKSGIGIPGADDLDAILKSIK